MTTALFLDPYFYRLREDKWSKKAHRTLEKLFSFVLNLLEKGEET